MKNFMVSVGIVLLPALLITAAIAGPGDSAGTAQAGKEQVQERPQIKKEEPGLSRRNKAVLRVEKLKAQRKAHGTVQGQDPQNKKDNTDSSRNKAAVK